MILYIYDHCPYCVKARMIFGLKKHPFQIKTLLNDDEKTPQSMIGVKMLPILEYSPGQFMPESLDIISYIDKLKPPSSISSSEDNKLKAWLDKNYRTAYKLAMPRWVKADLEEFKAPSARNYFQRKKETYIGPFEECLKESPELIKEMEQELKGLEFKKTFFKEELSLNDFHLFAFLRSLSIVKGLSFPEKVKSYMERLSLSGGVPLHQSDV